MQKKETKEIRDCWRCRKSFQTKVPPGYLYCKTCLALPNDVFHTKVISTKATVDPYRAGKTVKGTKNVKERDLLQPYRKDGSVNENFLAEYGSAPFNEKARAEVHEKFGK